MPEWVHVVHKDLPETLEAPPLVTRESYELMKKNGWRLATKADVAAAGNPRNVSPANPRPARKSVAKKEK